MIKKILIANRGEIACRIIKTAKLMGIKTVAVYSDADKDALHVSLADEAVHIGPPAVSESYIVLDKILDAALPSASRKVKSSLTSALETSGADAVHPGYGFLSENKDFALKLEAMGIAFIGPNVKAIELMGDKIASKKLALEAGVSCVPGHMGLIEDADEAVKIANKVGYPVMIKASAGGGGKGMRVAYNDEEAREGFASSKSEAKSSFGDDRIFIEKFIEGPRHIEIQIMGDKHGNIIHLGERECSIQRRNQKVIEEAPSPFLDEATRERMGAEAIALARAVDYDSAGTVEFIVDKDMNFYFLEMNTRLQVEHPVTELITGVDLVEQMIRVADGEELTLKQKDIKLNGWAIEARIYAEDPYRGFLPSIGRLRRYRAPLEGETPEGAIVRNDTGVREGGEISMYYDPMIAKLCTWGADRAVATRAMQRALDEFEIEGVGHNIPFLSAVFAQDRFERGDLTTNYIAEEFPDGFEGVPLNKGHRRKIACCCALMAQMLAQRNARSSGILQGHNRAIPTELCVEIEDMSYDVTSIRTNGSFQVTSTDGTDKAAIELEISSGWNPGMCKVSAIIDNEPFIFKAKPIPEGYDVRYRGAHVEVKVRTPEAALLAVIMPEKIEADTSNLLLCPMPGVVISVLVEAGDEVQDGQALAVVEAMKMENTLRAEKKGIIDKVLASAGDNLAVDEVILEFVV